MALSSLVNEAVALYKDGKKDEAINLLMQAIREDRKDEGAWYYLGVMVDDVARKKQAFEQTLKLNPENVRAKAALQKLTGSSNGNGASAPVEPPSQGDPSVGRKSEPSAGSAAGAKPTGSAKPKSSSGRIDTSDLRSTVTSFVSVAYKTTSKAARTLYNDGVQPPVVIEGAPERVTGPYLRKAIPDQTALSVKILTAPDPSLQEGTSIDVTWWEAILPIVCGAVALGLSEGIGRFLRAFFGLFTRLGTTLGTLVITPVFSAVVIMAAVGIGAAAGIWIAGIFLESQRMKIAVKEHTLYFAQLFLPALLVYAAIRLLAHIAAGLFRSGVFYSLSLFAFVVVAAFGAYILSKTYDRMYGDANQRGRILSGITVGVAALVMLLVMIIVGTLFRVPFL